MDRRLKSPADIEARCAEFGFLPFFRCGIPGFSVEEMVAPEFWFTDEEGAWEWKGPVIREGHCAYGKFFARKAGFVSREWLPDLTNYRRSRPLAPNEDTAALDDVVLQTVWSKERPLSRNCAKCWGSPEGAKNVRRTPRPRRSQRMRRFHSIRL